MPRSYMKNLHKNNTRSQPEWEWSITLNMSELSYYMYFILVIFKKKSQLQHQNN